MCAKRFLLVFFLFLSTASADSRAVGDDLRILLLGNSIIYTNNLPAVVEAVASPSKTNLDVDMYARPGADLRMLQDGNVLDSALDQRDYDYVVFHDRGGNAMCAADVSALDTECRKTLLATQRLVRKIVEHGATPIMMGTYQGSLEANRLLKKGEEEIGRRSNVKYINLTTDWVELRDSMPDAPWLAEDGVHPGRALTVLMAVKITEGITGSTPPVQRICTDKPLRIPSKARKGLVVHMANADPQRPTTEILPLDIYEELVLKRSQL